MKPTPVVAKDKDTGQKRPVLQIFNWRRMVGARLFIRRRPRLNDIQLRAHKHDSPGNAAKKDPHEYLARFIAVNENGASGHAIRHSDMPLIWLRKDE